MAATPETLVKTQLKTALKKIGVDSRAISVGFGGKRGMPDRFCLVHGHAIYFEVKRAGAKATPNQANTHDELRADGATVFMVWPHNIAYVVACVDEIRTHYAAFPGWHGRPVEEHLLLAPKEPAAGARRNTKRSPARPQLSRGGHDPEQHSFAQAIGYTGTQQNTVGLPLADTAGAQALPVAEADR